MTVLIPEAAEAATGAGAGEAGAGAGLRSRAGQQAKARAQQLPGQYAGYGREIGRQRLTPGARNYQGAILAEFLVAVLVVAFLPLASGRPNDDKGGPSPYRVTDMTQLVAIGAVYFLLALFSGGERSGRIVAWFGGLLLLGILFAKVGSGQLSAAVSSMSGVDKATLDNT